MKLHIPRPQRLSPSLSVSRTVNLSTFPSLPRPYLRTIPQEQPSRFLSRIQTRTNNNMADLTHLTAASLFNTKGWTAIVTGGGSGLGLITAQALAANGVKVYVTGRRVDKLHAAEMKHEASGGQIIAMQMDVTDKDSIRKGVEEISQKEKHINFLVNNAGVTSQNYGEKGMPAGSAEEVSKKMLEGQDFDSWLAVYKVNVASCYFVSAAFLPLLCAAKEVSGYKEAGSILNISSISGITKESQNGQFSYNASKAATISLTEQLAVDLKSLKVRVNTLVSHILFRLQPATLFLVRAHADDSTIGTRLFPVRNDAHR
jgi:NAD(P)-dependent dehydrogenase (short-subunit alcohol dehydrogenase family)